MTDKSKERPLCQRQEMSGRGRGNPNRARGHSPRTRGGYSSGRGGHSSGRGGHHYEDAGHQINWDEEQKKYQENLINEAYNLLQANNLLNDPSTNFVDTHVHLDLILQQKKFGISCDPLLSKKKFLQETFFAGTRNDSLFASKSLALLSKFDGCVSIYCEPASLSHSLGIWSDLLEIETSPIANTGIAPWKIVFSFGIHPHQANLYDENMEKRIIENMQACGPLAVALGECGLDYYKNHSEPEAQRMAFIRQLKVAVSLKKPIVIHTREAEKDTLHLLKTHVPQDHKIHIHCFTDSAAFAKPVMAHFPNAYFGFTGVLTYDSAVNVQELVKNTIPLNRILLETDGPYMPANIPGFNRNLGPTARSPKLRAISHCGHIIFIAQKIAELKAVSLGTVLKQVRQNTKNLYAI